MIKQMVLCLFCFCLAVSNVFAGEVFPNGFNSEQLRVNFLKRLQPLVSGKNATQKFALDDIRILQAEAVSLSNELNLYAVSVEIRHTQANGEQVTDTMLIVTDKTGRYQFGKIQELSSGYEAVLSRVPSLTEIVIPEELTQRVAKGTGAREVIFISDAFCPYCRQAFSYLLENMDSIHELKAGHLPLAMHPGADAAAWVMSYAKKQNIRPFDVMKFAYSDLVLPQTRPSNSTELEAIQKNIIAQFLKKFPVLAQGQDASRFFEDLKARWHHKITDDIVAFEKLKIVGTPFIIIDGQAVSGFNQKELDQKLHQ